MGNQPRISCLEEAYLILSLCLLLHHPRRPRDSQSGREKRCDECFTVQTGMLLLIASEMFSRVIGSSFVSGQGIQVDMKVSLARTTLVNEPDRYGETKAVVCEHTKRTQDMLFVVWAQKQKHFVPNQEPAFASIFGNDLVKVGTKGLFCLCSSRLFSRADSLALGLRGCFFFFLYCPVLY